MRIYCDTHVHGYQFEQLSLLLDHALANFDRHGANADDSAKVLFFTDGLHDRVWKRLRPLTDAPHQVGDWSLVFSASSQFIHATKASHELLLAPARQINSVNRLEYLLLGCDQDLDGDLDDADLITEYSQHYAVICPWGFGKWLGARGKLLSRLVTDFSDKLLLGDNGGRPAAWFWVPQFKLSKTSALNGSDPLPIDGELARVANVGIRLELPSDNLTVTNLVQQLKLGQHSNYGNNVSLWSFIKSQLAMRRS